MVTSVAVDCGLWTEAEWGVCWPGSEAVRQAAEWEAVDGVNHILTPGRCRPRHGRQQKTYCRSNRDARLSNKGGTRAGEQVGTCRERTGVRVTGRNDPDTLAVWFGWTTRVCDVITNITASRQL